MAQFNRERIPERQPHAKGSGAFGRFEVTHDVSAYTKATVFQPGTTTELVARFSTVAGERGSPDVWRDLRGFSLKFYTTDGNYDMVGNATPVFFVRDPLKFQNFIRSQKRRADNNLRDNDMHRLGVNYQQIPVNAPKVPVHSYSKDGVMRMHPVTDPVYFPNSKGGPRADIARYGEPAGWHTDGDMVHAAYTLHAEDDDWDQAGTLVRDVLDDAARTRLVNNIVGQLLNGVTEPVLLRTFQYLRNVDKDLGDRVEQGVRAGQP